MHCFLQVFIRTENIIKRMRLSGIIEKAERERKQRKKTIMKGVK